VNTVPVGCGGWRAGVALRYHEATRSHLAYQLPRLGKIQTRVYGNTGGQLSKIYMIWARAPSNKLKPVLRIRIRIDFGRLDPDPDPGGQKRKKKKKFMFLVLDFLFRGLEASHVACTSFMEALG
jgi:hypothetical protein